MTITDPPTATSTAVETIVTVGLEAGMTLLSDRAAGHRMIMELWGRLPGDESAGARSQASILWAPLTVDVDSGNVRVLVRSTIRPERTPSWVKSLDVDDAAAAPTAGQEVTVRASMVCVKTPMSDDVPAELRTALKAGADGSRRAPGEGRCYCRNPVPVPEADREAWAMARLERLGLSVTSCSMEASSEVRAPKGRSPWPVITVKATVTVRETETFANAWLTGTGKGKAYGFGMLIVK